MTPPTVGVVMVGTSTGLMLNVTFCSAKLITLVALNRSKYTPLAKVLAAAVTAPVVALTAMPDGKAALVGATVKVLTGLVATKMWLRDWATVCVTLATLVNAGGAFGLIRMVRTKLPCPPASFQLPVIVMAKSPLCWGVPEIRPVVALTVMPVDKGLGLSV